MKKKYYTATATMKDAEKVWDVLIYSLYETMEDAQDGVNRFKARYGDMVVKTTIK